MTVSLYLLGNQQSPCIGTICCPKTQAKIMLIRGDLGEQEVLYFCLKKINYMHFLFKKVLIKLFCLIHMTILNKS